MVAIDAWKAFKIGDTCPLFVKEVTDFLTRELVEEANEFENIK